jgi:hypothetical protein
MAERLGAFINEVTHSEDDEAGDYVVRVDRVVDSGKGSLADLESFVYAVADENGPLAEVTVEVEALFRGDEVLSRVAVRRLGANAVRFGGNAFETHVTPPLTAEEDRQQAVLAYADLIRTQGSVLPQPDNTSPR